MQGQSSTGVLLLLAGGGLFALGVFAGVSLDRATTPIHAAEPPSVLQPANAGEIREMRELLGALASEVRALRQLERPVAASPVAQAPVEPVAVSTREPILQPSSGALNEILARLERFEATQRELLAVERNGPGLLQPAVPQGMAVRDYLQALKNCGQGDEVKRAHLLWDMQRIRDAYGMPDEEADRGDYIEWIYKLPTEGTQFDFHFTGGLVVEAH
jgi:hypothetical protein